MNTARHIFFSGNVQGVGFRWRTHHVASHYDVTGYVRNLSDGRVELLVQGSAKEIAAFLAELQDNMGMYIRDRQDNTVPVSSRFSDFRIMY